MGLAKSQKIEGKTRGSKRGSTDNGRRLAAFSKGAGGADAEWAACDCRKIQAVIDSITQLGGAITFGLSRDKGAHSLTLLLDSERETLWFNGGADLDQELENVMGMLAALD